MSPTPAEGAAAFSIRYEIARLWARKWLVLGPTLGVAALAVVLTLPAVWPSEYKSTGAIIPPSFNYIKSLNFQKNNFRGFGAAEDEDLERMTAALRSDEAFEMLVRRFRLGERYETDRIRDPQSQARALRGKYDDRVEVRISDLSTVQIAVYDTDPDTAARMVNALIAFADTFVENVARRREGVAELEASVRATEEKLAGVRDSAARLRARYRLYHLDELSEVFSSRLADRAFSDPGFALNYDKLISLENHQEYLDEYLVEMLAELAFRKENLATYPSLVNVVSEGVPSRIKARPKRMLIVFLATVGAFLLSALGTLYFTRPKA